MSFKILDGPIGTYLINSGFTPPFEDLNISHPDLIQMIHRHYVQAGSDILYTHTFAAKDIRQCEAAWNNISIFDVKKFISIGPMANHDLVINYFSKHNKIFVFETIYNLDYAKDVISKYSHLDCIFSFTLPTSELEKAIELLREKQVIRIGLNCGPGIKYIEEQLRIIPKEWDILLKPNLGDIETNSIDELIEKLCTNYNIKYFGGCCDSDSSFISKLFDKRPR